MLSRSGCATTSDDTIGADHVTLFFFLGIAAGCRPSEGSQRLAAGPKCWPLGLVSFDLTVPWTGDPVGRIASAPPHRCVRLP